MSKIDTRDITSDDDFKCFQMFPRVIYGQLLLGITRGHSETLGDIRDHLGTLLFSGYHVKNATRDITFDDDFKCFQMFPRVIYGQLLLKITRGHSEALGNI